MRDVAGHVVAPGVDPETVVVELGLEPYGVVDDDLAGEKDERQVFPEGPGGDGVGDELLDLAVLLELLEHELRLVAVEVVALRGCLPMGAIGGLHKRKLDGALTDGGGSGQRFQAFFHHGRDPGGDLLAVALRIVDTA